MKMTMKNPTFDLDNGGGGVSTYTRVQLIHVTRKYGKYNCIEFVGADLINLIKTIYFLTR